MSNPNGSTPANGHNGQAQNPQFDPNGYPQNGSPQNGQPGYAQHGQAQGHPQQGYPQGQPHPGHRQQWQQPEPPKKKNFFVRHKILTGLLALCVVGGIAATAGGKKDDAAPSTSASSDTKASGSAATESKGETKADEKTAALPALGTPIKDGDLEFTVTKVERDQASVGDQYLNEKAQGAFTLVYVSVKNTGTQTQSVMSDGQKAYDAKGIGYEANSTASIYVKGNDAFFKEINPGNTLKGVFVFDAPKGAKLTKVRLHESMFSNGVEGPL